WLALGIGFVGAFFYPKSVGQFMLTGIEVVPFAILALLTYMGVRLAWARVLAYLWLAVVLLGVGGASLLLAAVVWVPPARSGVAPSLAGGFGWHMARVLVAVVLGFAAAVACALPPVRD